MKEGIQVLKTIAVLLLFVISNINAQHKHTDHKKGDKHNEHAGHHPLDDEITTTYFKQMQLLRDTSEDDNEKIFGSWESVIPNADGAAIGAILGMQTVHNVLLPSGKVLISSGSSWRNYKDIQYYPEYEDPASAMGLFNLYDNPFRNSNTYRGQAPNYRKIDYYNLVNNTAIFDPQENSFYRIPHPVPQDASEKTDDGESYFVPSDLFCSAHLQLPNGNPLFIGGTQYYFPYRTGTNSTFIFDWKKELDINWKSIDWRVMPETKNNKNYPWEFSGFMKRGRWYPSIVPLLDGRFVIFSGFVGFDKGYPTMYRFEINPYIEFFNPDAYASTNPQLAWKDVDVKKAKNSPFTTPINNHFVPTACTDHEFHSYWEAESCKNDFPLPCQCDAQCKEDNKYDSFKLYPNNYLVENNKIYLTREGDWVSLRTTDVAYMRKTKNTYFMEFNDNVTNPKVTFSHGPNRAEEVTSYGTSYRDPNTKNITILGGQPTSQGTLFPIDSDKPTLFAGGEGSRKKEEFWFNETIANNESKWTIDRDFLGKEEADNRTMLTAIILPTKEVIIINGGNYDFYGPVFYPILLTPNYDSEGKYLNYTRTRMSNAIEPRLYHNSAMLLPNGQILVSGGNSARASVAPQFPNPTNQHRNGQPKPDLDQVDVDMYFFRDGQMAKAVKGMQTTPTENWTAELFSPPYLHIDNEKIYDKDSTSYTRKIRTSKITGLTAKDADIQFKETLADKDYYLLKSDRSYTMNITDLPETSGTKKEQVVLIKLPSFTHNWNNGQFFVDLQVEESKKGTLAFKTPNMKQQMAPPGFYMLFYIDSKGKPSYAQMVRFDDKAKSPLQE